MATVYYKCPSWRIGGEASLKGLKYIIYAQFGISDIHLAVDTPTADQNTAIIAEGWEPIVKPTFDKVTA